MDNHRLARLALLISLGAPSLAAAQVTGTIHFGSGSDAPLVDGRWTGHRGVLPGAIQGMSLQYAAAATSPSISYHCWKEGPSGPVDSGLLAQGTFCGTAGAGTSSTPSLVQFSAQLAGNAAPNYDVYYQCELDGGIVKGPYANGAAPCGDGVHKLKAVQVWTMKRGGLAVTGSAQATTPIIPGTVATDPGATIAMGSDGMIGNHQSTRGIQSLSLALAAAGSVTLQYTCIVDGKLVTPGAGAPCTGASGTFLDGFTVQAVPTTPGAASTYDVIYTCDARGLGATNVAMNGALCGTRDIGRPLTALGVWLRPKTPAPATTCAPGKQSCANGASALCATDVTTAPNCGGCGITCDDGNPNTVDKCVAVSGAATCINVDVRACQKGCGPSATDTDKDGLNDVWEQNGYIDLDCDGVFDPYVAGASPPIGDTPLPHADPATRNVYVKYDYLAGAHSHQPTTTAMTLVQQAYAAHDVILSFFPTSDAIAEKGDAGVVNLFDPAMSPPPSPTCLGSNSDSLYTLKKAHFASYLAPAYHYIVFSHYNTCDSSGACAACPSTGKSPQPEFGTTGLAELPGNDVIVSLGTLMDQGVNPVPDLSTAGSFMHELGHNLGLRHGGGDDSPAQKPNYISVMNYTYQFGIGATASPGPYATDINDPSLSYRVDYSSFVGAALDEGAPAGGACVAPSPMPANAPPGMNRAAGVAAVGAPNPHPTDVVVFFSNGGDIHYAPSNGTPINWDSSRNGTSGIAFADVTGDQKCQTLNGWNDWDNLQPSPSCGGGNWAEGAPLGCMTAARAKKLIHRDQAVTIMVAPSMDKPSAAEFRRHLTGPDGKRMAHGGFRARMAVRHGRHVPVQVAILGTKEMAAAAIEVGTLRFGGVPAEKDKKPEILDADGDGIDDLVVEFPMSPLHLNRASRHVALTGAFKGPGGKRMQITGSHPVHVAENLEP